MVASDSDTVQCTAEWFHFQCVGISEPPEGEWFCEECLTNDKGPINSKYFENANQLLKIYRCAECGKTFSQKSNLKVHQTTHQTDERPFPCSECQETFKSLGHLSGDQFTYRKKAFSVLRLFKIIETSRPLVLP